jgi:hypothetical protein
LAQSHGAGKEGSQTMPTQNDDPGAPTENLPGAEDMQEMTDRISELVERSQKVWAESLDRSVGDMATAKPDPR